MSETTDLSMLQTIRSQTLALIRDLTAAPKPSYDIDGQRLAWGEYLQQLIKTVEWCDAQLARVDPCELHSTGYTP